MGRDIFDMSKFTGKKNAKPDNFAKNILVYWDISLSQGILVEEKNREKDIRLMKKLIAKWKEERFYQCIYICLANDKIENIRQFSIQDERGIVEFLTSVKYHGSTDFSTFFDQLASSDQIPKKENMFSFCVFFSNGFDTFGNSNKLDLFASNKSNLPIFFCCSSGMIEITFLPIYFFFLY